MEAAVALGSKKGKGLVEGPCICPNARVVVMQRHLVKLMLPDHAAFEIVIGKPPSFPFVGQVMKAAAVGNKVKGKKQHPIGLIYSLMMTILLFASEIQSGSWPKMRTNPS